MCFRLPWDHNDLPGGITIAKELFHGLWIDDTEEMNIQKIAVPERVRDAARMGS